MNSMKYSAQLIFLLCTLISMPLMAADDEIAKLTKNLTGLIPADASYEISKTPVPGLYEVDFGDYFVYITSDGQHIVKGDIINMVTNVNLTDTKRGTNRLKSLSVVSEKDMVIYPAKNKKTSMTVFTDIDCSYCRKLHSEMKGYNEQGIEVRYVFYPRAGLGSNSHQKATSVWCAENQRKALDEVKSGLKIEKRDCDTPIIKHVEVANQLGVNSTPTLIFDDGTMMPGYIPAARLPLILKQRKIIP